MQPKLPFDMDELFEDGNMGVIETMADIMKVQQQGAIDLTRLVLEHCKEKEITKQYVFEIFEEAMNFLKSQLNQDDDD